MVGLVAKPPSCRPRPWPPGPAGWRRRMEEVKSPWGGRGRETPRGCGGNFPHEVPVHLE